jgi:hypothetical protein
MAKYRKKPVVIEAEQFVIWDLNNIPDNVTILGNKYCVFNSNTPHPYIYIPALGGNVKCYNLDWVCKGVEGELYPCKESIFLKTYEKV